MLVIVAILLIFGAVVRHKWKNAAAKKEEILRLLAAASGEEAEIAKLEAVDVFKSSPPLSPSPSPLPLPPQIQKPYFCAVCYSPTTTRCSQCKAVRYWLVFACFWVLCLDLVYLSIFLLQFLFLLSLNFAGWKFLIMSKSTIKIRVFIDI